MSYLVESVEHVGDRGWIIASQGRRRWRWDFRAKDQREFAFWSEMVLRALRRIA